jgi:hypothetical protein
VGHIYPTGHERVNLHASTLHFFSSSKFPPPLSPQRMLQMSKFSLKIRPNESLEWYSEIYLWYHRNINLTHVHSINLATVKKTLNVRSCVRAPWINSNRRFEESVLRHQHDLTSQNSCIINNGPVGASDLARHFTSYIVRLVIQPQFDLVWNITAFSHKRAILASRFPTTRVG